jgi:RHS repeat-associated protein
MLAKKGAFFARTDPSGTYAMMRDALGSTIGLVNSSGSIGTGYQYGSFGQTTASGASSTNPFQYTGREMDPTGLYFMRARYYNPIAQRFISPDPIGLLSGQANFYALVFNDPMDWADPLGLMSISIVSPDHESATCIAFCGDNGGPPPPAIESLAQNGMSSFGVPTMTPTVTPSPSNTLELYSPSIPGVPRGTVLTPAVYAGVIAHLMGEFGYSRQQAEQIIQDEIVTGDLLAPPTLAVPAPTPSP